MRVGCNLLWLVPGRVGGTEMATVAMLRQMAAEPRPDLDLSLFALDAFGQTYPDLAEAFPTQLVPLTGRLRPLRVAAENSWLARATRSLDLVHHLGGVLPPVRSTPAVVTIHDLQPFDMPENFEPLKRHFLQRSIPQAVKRAAGVIVPTEFVRRGIVDRFGVPAERVSVAPWGVEPPTSDVSVAEVQARYGLPRRWFAFPSFTWNHKNHDVLLRAFATVAAREHDTMLVLTGGEGPAEQAVVEQISELGLRGRVRRTGLIPRRDVMAIVRGAVAMTFPSRYEGFGLPVLEAMGLGTPVLAADAAAVPEVVGPAARLLPVDDVDAWADAMVLMLDDGRERQRLVELGHEWVARFTWEHTAEATVAAYEAALPEPAGPAEAPPPEAAAAAATATEAHPAATDDAVPLPGDGAPDDGATT